MLSHWEMVSKACGVGGRLMVRPRSVVYLRSRADVGGRADEVVLAALIERVGQTDECIVTLAV